MHTGCVPQRRSRRSAKADDTCVYVHTQHCALSHAQRNSFEASNTPYATRLSIIIRSLLLVVQERWVQRATHMPDLLLCASHTFLPHLSSTMVMFSSPQEVVGTARLAPRPRVVASMSRAPSQALRAFMK